MPPPYGGACILTEFNIAEVLSNIYAIFNKHIIVAGNDRESSNAVYMTLSLSLSVFRFATAGETGLASVYWS